MPHEKYFETGIILSLIQSAANITAAEIRNRKSNSEFENYLKDTKTKEDMLFENLCIVAKIFTDYVMMKEANRPPAAGARARARAWKGGIKTT